MHLRKMRKKWQCIVRHKGHMITQSFVAKSGARLWGERTNTELRNVTYRNNDKLISMRLKDLLQLYLEKAMHKSKRPQILKYDVEMLRRFPMARTSLAAISAVKLANFRDERLKAGKSTSTVRSYLKLISRAITIGQRELGIPLQTNPVSLIEKPKQAAPRDRTLSIVELQKLLDACHEDKKFHFLAAFVEVAFLTLCRRGELLNLKWTDIDWINSTAHIAETKIDKPRTIGLSPRVLQILKALPRTVDGIFFPVRSISSFEKSFRAARKRPVAPVKSICVIVIKHSPMIKIFIVSC